MIRHSRPGIILRLIVIGALLALVATACTSDDEGDGVSQADFDALQEQLDDANAELVAMQDQMVTATVNQQVVQAGTLGAAPAAAEIPDDGWTNAESIRGGLFLEAQLDSSGEDAWDIAAHPRVYFTSESFQSNYFNDNELDAELGNFAGWHVVDAYTKEIVASALYHDLVPGEANRGPHGVGVSPDGKWGYVGFATAPAEGCEGEFTACDRVGYVMVVNIQTMKVDKILRQQSYFEGGFRSQAIHHIQCWTHDESGEDYCILQWGFGANGGPHHIIKPNDNNRVYRSITYDDVKPMGHPFTTPSPDGQYVYISMGANFLRHSDLPGAGIAKYDITTGKHEEFHEVGRHPIGITHTQDGKYTYVVDGTSSQLYKLDNETLHVVDRAAAGIAGPYGICLNFDESEAWINGKGEGTANLGNSMSIFDLERFRASRSYGNTPFYLGGSASSVDHCAFHPDPEVNEVWISNMKGWETIVVDLNTYEVEAYIATPNNGDTHGMAFVYYDNGWDSGELMVDMGGPKSQSLQDYVLAQVAASGDA
jgi:DNA-binding beta-propeller fold protein YncE